MPGLGQGAGGGGGGARGARRHSGYCGGGWGQQGGGKGKRPMRGGGVAGLQKQPGSQGQARGQDGRWYQGPTMQGRGVTQEEDVRVMAGPEVVKNNILSGLPSASADHNKQLPFSQRPCPYASATYQSAWQASAPPNQEVRTRGGGGEGGENARNCMLQLSNS